MNECLMKQINRVGVNIKNLRNCCGHLRRIYRFETRIDFYNSYVHKKLYVCKKAKKAGEGYIGVGSIRLFQ